MCHQPHMRYCRTCLCRRGFGKLLFFFCRFFSFFYIYFCCPKPLVNVCGDNPCHRSTNLMRLRPVLSVKIYSSMCVHSSTATATMFACWPHVFGTGVKCCVTADVKLLQVWNVCSCMHWQSSVIIERITHRWFKILNAFKPFLMALYFLICLNVTNWVFSTYALFRNWTVFTVVFVCVQIVLFIFAVDIICIRINHSEIINC